MTQPVLKLGSRGPMVGDLQAKLAVLGIYRSTIDGHFGPKTQAAVKNFQAFKGLGVDGVVGPQTWFALSVSASPGNSSPSPATQTPVGLPSRDEVIAVYRDMANGKIPVPGGAWKDIRETHGKNRSPVLDAMILRQGGRLGEPYCMYGQQEALDELCKHYKVSRRKVDLPEGGSTQSVWEAVPKRFKTQSYIPFCWWIWRKGEEWKGHVGMGIGPEQKGSAETFEFNTGRGNGLERDGEGAHFKTRDIANGYPGYITRGYVDVYAALIEAMKEG